MENWIFVYRLNKVPIILRYLNKGLQQKCLYITDLAFLPSVTFVPKHLLYCVLIMIRSSAGIPQTRITFNFYYETFHAIFTSVSFILTDLIYIFSHFLLNNLFCFLPASIIVVSALFLHSFCCRAFCSDARFCGLGYVYTRPVRK